MQFKFKLFHDDYLKYQLFAASQSALIIKRRKLEWLFSTLFFLILAIIFLITHIYLLVYYFSGLTLLSALFFPYYSRSRYKKHYSKNLKHTFFRNFGSEVHVEFTEDAFRTLDAKSESKISFSDLSSISEIESHFFIHFKSGASLIIPKTTSISSFDIKNELVSIASKQNIKYNSFPDWKWK